MSGEQYNPVELIYRPWEIKSHYQHPQFVEKKPRHKMIKWQVFSCTRKGAKISYFYSTEGTVIPKYCILKILNLEDFQTPLKKELVSGFK